MSYDTIVNKVLKNDVVAPSLTPDELR